MLYTYMYIIYERYISDLATNIKDNNLVFISNNWNTQNVEADKEGFDRKGIDKAERERERERKSIFG